MYSTARRVGNDEERKIIFGLAFSFLLIVLFIILLFFLIHIDRKNEELSQKVFSDLAKVKPENGTILFLLNPEDPAWCGKIEYIRIRMGDIVTASRELGIMNENILPIRLGVVTMKWMPIYDGEADPVISRIVLGCNALRQSNRRIDKLLAHEFAHLLTWYYHESHGVEWRSVYNTLHRALRKI